MAEAQFETEPLPGIDAVEPREMLDRIRDDVAAITSRLMLIRDAETHPFCRWELANAIGRARALASDIGAVIVRMDGAGSGVSE